MKTNRREAARRKLLDILPRKELEQLSGHDRPHALARSDLIALLVHRWPHVAIVDAVIDEVFATAQRAILT